MKAFFAVSAMIFIAMTLGAVLAAFSPATARTCTGEMGETCMMHGSLKEFPRLCRDAPKCPEIMQ